jgi:tripartite ATP-independent transporter DctM subunit
MLLIRCRLNPELAPLISYPDRAVLRRERLDSLKEIWPLMALILGIIGGLYGGVVTPTEAGAAGALLAVVIGVSQRKLNFAKFLDSLRDSMATTAQLFFVGMGAVMYTKLLALAGIGPMFTDMIGNWSVDPVLLVIAASIVYLILGMFLDPLGIVLITIPVFVPMFNALHLDLVWFGVLVVKYVEIGMLTPPVGFNVYVVKNVVGDAIGLETIFKGVGWFLVCEVVIMTLLIVFPEISLWLPSTMG